MAMSPTYLASQWSLSSHMDLYFFNYVTAAGKTISKSESHSKSLTPSGIHPQKCQPRKNEKTDKERYRGN